MKFKVEDQENDAFEISTFEVKENAKTRTHLALSIFYVCVSFLICSAVYGLKVGNFEALKTVFEYVQIPIATLLGYYFGAKNG